MESKTCGFRIPFYLLLYFVELNVQWQYVAYLFCVFANLQSCCTKDIFNVVTNFEDIVSCINLPLTVGFIEACKVTLCNSHGEGLGFTWVEKACFSEGFQLFGRLFVCTLRSCYINLSNLLACNLTGVLNRYANCNLVTVALY